jgi:Terminase large subunit, T4likevirus-type, N-terminal
VTTELVLPESEQERRTRALLDPFTYINDYCMIRPAAGGSAVPFTLWPAQREALDAIHLNRMTVFLKARQLGLSWLALAYALRHASLNRGRTVLILNRNAGAAYDLMRRVRFMYERLPDWLKPRLTVDNASTMRFGDLDSQILSLPTTENSGRGMTATMVIIDEWAFLRWAEQLWLALEPTLSAGGKFIGISTANGYHGQYARIWRGAVDNKNGIKAVFLPWYAHPDRDQAWYDERRKVYADAAIRGDGLRELHREFPATAEEAFATSGLEVFGDEWSRADHVISGPAIPEGTKRWPSIRGIDFGYHHSPVLWLRVEQNRNVVVYHELPAERLTTVELGEEIAKHDQELGIPTATTPAGVDPAGNAQTSVGQPDVVALRKVGVKSKWARVKPEDRVRLIKQLLRERRLFIHNSCTRLIEALERAQWDVGADQIPRETYGKDGLYDHYLDALGYALIVQFPPKITAQARRAETPNPRRQYDAWDGSSEF